MVPLSPAPFDAVEDHELWDRIVHASGAGRLKGDELRSAVLCHAVRQLGARLGDDAQLDAVATAAAADEDSYGWAGAEAQARALALHEAVDVVILFLLSERTASGAAESAWARALVGAAAQRCGGQWDLDPAADALLKAHGVAFSALIEAQHELTRELMNGLTEVTLHRAVKLTQPVAAGTANPQLRPLSSFSTVVDYAKSLATGGYDSRGPGEIVVFSANVPTPRIVSTPATGWGAALEREVVVGMGAQGDWATVTLPDR